MNLQPSSNPGDSCRPFALARPAVDPGSAQITGRTRIETARLADLDALVALEQQCFDAAVAIPPRQFRYLLSRPTAQVWVVYEDGQVVADVVLLRRRTRQGILGRFYSLAVAASHRRRGYGRKLMQVGMAELCRAGAYAAVLEVRLDNAHAVRLYEQEGFRKVRILSDYYAPGQHAVKLQARLPL